MLCKSTAQESALSLAADRRTAALLGGTAQRAAVASSLHSLGRSHAPLKGSVGEGSNHSNFSHQNSVRILSEFRKIHQKFSEINFLKFSEI